MRHEKLAYEANVHTKSYYKNKEPVHLPFVNFSLSRLHKMLIIM